MILALFLRDLLNELGNSRFGFIMLFGRPALVTGFFFLVYTSAQKTPQGMPLVAFLATGWLGWFAFIRAFKDIVKSSQGGAGILLFPQVSPLDMFIENLLVEWFVYTLVFGAFVLGALLIARTALPAHPLQVIFAFWSIIALGASLALIFSSAARIFPAISTLTIIIRRGGSLISGVALTGADTPDRILSYMSWSPLFHCFELMREAWWPAYVSPFASGWFVAKCIFLMIAFGLAVERFTRRYIDA